MTKTHLITGITGMVGSHLLDYLYKNTDDNIIGICRWRSPLINISSYLKIQNKPNSRVKLEYADLNDMSSMLTVFNKHKPDFIYHLAAHSYPQTSFISPIDTLQTNINGLIWLQNKL